MAGETSAKPAIPERNHRSTMTHDEILQVIVSTVREIFERDVDQYDDFFSLGGDSINAIDLAARLEEVLGLEIDHADIWGAESFHDFATRLTRESGQGVTRLS